MTDASRTSLEHLVDEVVGDVWGMPVRAMEAVLAHGPQAVEPVARGLREALERRGEPWRERGPFEEAEILEPLWLAVLLGQLGSRGGAPPLVETIRTAGEEEIGPGQATLLAEAARLADLHGDPEGLLSGGAPVRTEGPARAPETPGRNDPCPCDSGRKYKKCCGPPG